MKTQPRNSYFGMVILGVILLGIGFGVGHGSWSWLQKESESPEDNDSTADQSGPAVDALIKLDRTQQREFGIAVTPCGPGQLEMHRTFPGEIELNADRNVRLCARVSGVVRQVQKALGDRVQAGDVLAVIQSPDLAAWRAAYLSAVEHMTLAEAQYDREKELRAQTITSEQTFQEAGAALAEARIALRNAEQSLLCLGYTMESLGQLAGLSSEAFANYAVTAPFDATMIDKHMAVGQAVEAASEVFVLADLTQVWADLNVPAEAGSEVRSGQAVVVTDSTGRIKADAMITYIAPVIDEVTRTILVRVNLPNAASQWRPGQFVTGQVTAAQVTVSLIVPRTAVQPVDNRSCVFVSTDQGFVPHIVTLGQSDETSVEILSGLEPGQSVVTSGAFTLKAEWLKETFRDED